MLNGESEIGLIYDFASEKECKHIIANSSPFLKATPYFDNGKMMDFSQRRTSKVAMFNEENDDIFKQLGKRIELATRMHVKENNFDHGEDIQVNVVVC